MAHLKHKAWKGIAAYHRCCKRTRNKWDVFFLRCIRFLKPLICTRVLLLMTCLTNPNGLPFTDVWLPHSQAERAPASQTATDGPDGPPFSHLRAEPEKTCCVSECRLPRTMADGSNLLSTALPGIPFMRLPLGGTAEALCGSRT